jgi:excisionase family DNA binding protein
MSQTQLKQVEAPTLLTTKEASEALRISRWKLYDLIRSRKIDTVKIGRRRFVPVDALASLISQLRREGD